MSIMESEVTNTSSEAEPVSQAEEREPTEAEIEEAIRDLPLPPPTFEFLIFSLRSQAEMQLGLFHLGEEKDRPKPNLRMARHTVDLIAMLVDKTKGNLTLEEQRAVENTLTELRFRYVQAAESTAKG
jgi:hypothetical protein